MIFDKLFNTNRYASIADLALMPKVIEQFKAGAIPAGKSEIAGSNDCWVINIAYETKDVSECLWEAHKKYLDVHVLMAGTEHLHVTDIHKMKNNMEYNEEGDYWLFDGNMEHDVLLEMGQFLILYPNEVHKTAIVVDQPVEVKKLVFKFPI